MQWSSDLPTQAGWYWVKHRYGFGAPHIVHVIDRRGKLTIKAGPTTPSLEKYYGANSMWAGPIELPDEDVTP